MVTLRSLRSLSSLHSTALFEFTVLDCAFYSNQIGLRISIRKIGITVWNLGPKKWDCKCHFDGIILGHLV